MKKSILILIALILPLMFCFACGGSEIDGEYRQYNIQNQYMSEYYSMTLKSGKYKLVEVSISDGKTSETNKSEGKFSFDEESGAITFVETNGEKFSGEIKNGVLDFTYKYVMYVMS